MAVVLRQSATADSTAPTVATWPSAPLAGSLLVGVLFHRHSDTAPAVFPTGWTVHVDRKTLLGDISARRGLAIATKVAGASEPTTVEADYGDPDEARLSIHELEPTAGETFTFLEAASNDNGTTDDASTIATGTTSDTGSGARLVIGAFGGRIGASSPLLQGTSAWTDDLGDIVNHAGGGNTRATSFAFAEHGTGGAKSSTATTDPETNENTGLSAAVLVFDTGAGVTVDVDHGLVMGHDVTVDTGTGTTINVAHGLLMSHLAAVETQPPPAPPPPLPTVTAERLVATWTPDGGLARVLTRGGGDLGQLTKPGVVGLDLPPDAQFEQQLAVGDGAILTGRRRLSREVIFGVWLRGDTLTEFETRRRQLARDFDPGRDGTFTWSLPDGTSRSLRCRTFEFEPEHGHRASLQLQGRWRVILRARDPYWFGEQRGIEFLAPAGDNFYGGGAGEGLGAPPYIISESTVFGQTAVTIGGDENTWPVWELHGPMTTATLDNLTSGKSLDLTPNLLLGETLTVRTDPRVIASQKFTDDTGANVWGAVAGQFPELWSLLPSVQTIDVTAAGADANTKIVLRYQERFLTA